MRKVELRPDAKADLEDIADYTTGERGSDQAKQYLSELRGLIERLPITALHHPQLDDVIPGLRKARSGRHLVFYFVTDNTIEVARVLHERMDHKNL